MNIFNLKFSFSDGTSLGLELKPVYDHESRNLPEYLETKLLTRELSNIFIRQTNLLLDTFPRNIDQARAIYNTWQGSTHVFYFQDDDSDKDKEEIDVMNFYKELDMIIPVNSQENIMEKMSEIFNESPK